jgi:NAD-dependent dihydropyrimidine dehydrogenase PreA subunit
LEGDVTHTNSKKMDQPVPIIEASRCDGCNLCVQVCPTGALLLQDGQAVVAQPQVCEYSGLCEMICPAGAIQRPFEIVMRDAPSKDHNPETEVKEQ